MQTFSGSRQPGLELARRPGADPGGSAWSLPGGQGPNLGPQNPSAGPSGGRAGDSRPAGGPPPGRRSGAESATRGRESATRFRRPKKAGQILAVPWHRFRCPPGCPRGQIRDEIRESATRLPVFATSYPNRARIIGGGDNFGREKGQLGDNPKFGAFGRAPGRSGFWLSPGPVLVVPFSGEIRILAVPWPRFGCPLAPFWLSPGQAPEARGAF